MHQDARTCRKRREPEATVLYRALQDHLATFLENMALDPNRSLPRFVERDLREFLRCGILAHGFCRVHCTACGKDTLVAFSCKRRSFCPACGTRRMVDTAAHIVDRVLPDVPVRQWVLALPHEVRFLCAYDPELCAAVRRVFVRAVASFYKHSAVDRGHPDPRPGAIVFTQRFDSALRLNVHFHALWPDGVFTCEPFRRNAQFWPTDPLRGADVERLTRAIRQRVVRLLRKRGKLDDDDPPELSLHETLGAAAVQGRIAFGENAGGHVPRRGRGTDHGAGEFRRGALRADCDGFSLHAGVCIPEGCPERLEKLCRYAARPPIVHERMSFTKDGAKILYKLKRRWRDGSTHVVFDPLTLIERLAALVPRPRVHLTTYHRVFAPAASYRDRIVPTPPEVLASGASCEHDHEPPDQDPPSRSVPRPRRDGCGPTS